MGCESVSTMGWAWFHMLSGWGFSPGRRVCTLLSCRLSRISVSEPTGGDQTAVAWKTGNGGSLCLFAMWAWSIRRLYVCCIAARVSLLSWVAQQWRAITQLFYFIATQSLNDLRLVSTWAIFPYPCNDTILPQQRIIWVWGVRSGPQFIFRLYGGHYNGSIPWFARGVRNSDQIKQSQSR